MSYILEALKKAEQDRVAVQRTDRQSMVLSALPTASTRPVWPFAATVVAVLVVAAGAGWWFSGRSSGAVVAAKSTAGAAVANMPATAPAAKAVNPPVNVAPTPVSELIVKPLERAPDAIALAAPSTQPAAQLLPATKTEKPRSVASAASLPVPGKTGPEPAPVAKLQEQPATKAVEPLDLKMSMGLRVVAMDELPPDIRKLLPKITAGGYVYSADASSRVVNINDKTLREGDDLASGLKLDQIAQDHVVFSFRGHRFRVDMF